MTGIGERDAAPRLGAVTPLQPGDPERIGRYELSGRLGAGGMGTVYLGRVTGGPAVAVKVVHPELAGDPEFRARFADEVAAARRVAPFCTARVLDADPAAAQPYLVTEYVDGVPLSTAVNDGGPLDESMLHGVALGVAAALAAVHAAGVVHRDLKPGNVLLSLSGPRVIDFGIARALDAARQHTQVGMLVGTPGWMAPEQFRGGHVGPPADVFSWGSLVAYAATGRNPWTAATTGPSLPPTEQAHRILHGEPTLDGVTGPLRRLVDSALAKDPSRRPTARQLVDALLGGAPGAPTVVAGAAADPTRAAASVVEKTWTGLPVLPGLAGPGPAGAGGHGVGGPGGPRAGGARPGGPGSGGPGSGGPGSGGPGSGGPGSGGSGSGGPGSRGPGSSGPGAGVGGSAAGGPMGGPGAGRPGAGVTGRGGVGGPGGRPSGPAARPGAWGSPGMPLPPGARPPAGPPPGAPGWSPPRRPAPPTRAYPPPQSTRVLPPAAPRSAPAPAPVPVAAPPAGKGRTRLRRAVSSPRPAPAPPTTASVDPPRRRRRWWRRKRLLVPLALLVAVAVFSPKSNPDPPASGSQLGTAVRDGNLEFVVSRVRCGVPTVGSGVLKRTADGQFCLADVRVTNVKDDARTLYEPFQKIVDSRGGKHGAAVSMRVVYRDQTLWDKVEPGEQVSGTMVFDIPKDVGATALELHDGPVSGGVVVRIR